MLSTVRRALSQPLVARWLTLPDLAWRTAVVPQGSQTVTVEGPDSDRILLAGSGLAVGFAAQSHEFALGGHLARQVSAITGRGARVDILAGPQLEIDRLCTLLDSARLASLDVLVATLGTVETLAETTPKQWRGQVESFLSHVSAHGPASLQVLLVATPELSRLVPMDRAIGQAVDRSAVLLNAEVAQACALHRNVTFVPFTPQVRPPDATVTSETYAGWASLIAPMVGAALNAQVTGERMPLP